MSRYTGPKAKIVRRFGMNILGSEKYDRILGKRNYPPGVHGKGKFSKPSEFGKQLIEKQKLRFMFGLTERQCRNYYEKATRTREKTGDVFMTLIERRLDNVIYRAGFAKTRAQARQMVNHGIFSLNGRRVKIPSVSVYEGDTFAVTEKKRGSPLFKNLEKRKVQPAPWIKVDIGELKGEILRFPSSEEFEKSVTLYMIIEFYSK